MGAPKADDPKYLSKFGGLGQVTIGAVQVSVARQKRWPQGIRQVPGGSSASITVGRIAGYSLGGPYGGSLGKVFRPDRDQVLLAPLHHDGRQKRIESGLIELDCAARHRFGPAAVEAPTVQGLRHCLRVCRLRPLHGLSE